VKLVTAKPARLDGAIESRLGEGVVVFIKQTAGRLGSGSALAQHRTHRFGAGQHFGRSQIGLGDRNDR
jgi:hypothetical protein